MRVRNVGWRLPWACFLFSLSLTNTSGQQAGASGVASGTPAPIHASSTSTSEAVSTSVANFQTQKENPTALGPTVRIGPGDDLDVSVFGLPELSQHVRVSNSGGVSLPLIGNVHLGGLSSSEAQVLIERRLADGHFVNDPHVSVYVKEYTTEGISLMGEVNRPAVYSPLGAHRLLDLIEAAGGLTGKAGRTVAVAHRDEPRNPITLTLSNDATKRAVTNIELWPGDTIVVSKAGIIYVVGEVNRPGGFVMEDNKITASQVVAMAAGPTRMAALNATKMLRRTPEGLKDIPVPLKKVLEAKIPDIELQPDDIIWVPSSRTTGITSTGISTIISMLTSLAIYRL